MTRGRLAAALAVVTPLGFLTKVYEGPGRDFVRGYVGGLLYEVSWVLIVLSLRPAARPPAVAAWVFLATALVETAQLWHPPWLERVRETFLGHALLGSTFHPFDFAAYAGGCAAALGLVFLLRPEPKR